MKILFIVTDFFPGSNANSFVIQKLIEKIRFDNKVYILDISSLPDCKIGEGSFFGCDISYLKIADFNLKKLLKESLKAGSYIKAIKAFCSLFAMKFHLHLNPLNYGLYKKLSSAAEKIIFDNDIDTVVSVSNPLLCSFVG